VCKSARSSSDRSCGTSFDSSASLADSRSVRVVAGQELQTGERLGEAGNSGNTGEPHLHIHAQTPGTADAPLAGTPLPIRIGGRYRYRNAGLAVR